MPKDVAFISMSIDAAMAEIHSTQKLWTDRQLALQLYLVDYMAMHTHDFIKPKN